nr:MAG TPA: hypothetical protein [Caudoviricetes sp.]
MQLVAPSVLDVQPLNALCVFEKQYPRGFRRPAKCLPVYGLTRLVLKRGQTKAPQTSSRRQRGNNSNYTPSL